MHQLEALNEKAIIDNSDNFLCLNEYIQEIIESPKKEKELK
jgi:hypothetical protein